jgi:hypothetical protein
VQSIVARATAKVVSRGAWGRHGRIFHWLVAGAAGAMTLAAPATEARGALQCVPYARSVSGITIRGDAHLWWRQAAGTYERGQLPEVGAVLSFRSTAAMPLGHVAVVQRVVDQRRILLNHANWSGPGKIEQSALAEDVSPAGDWSAVRVWYARTGSLGRRVNQANGFIYPRPARDLPAQGPVVRLALADLASPNLPPSSRALAGIVAAGRSVSR